MFPNIEHTFFSTMPNSDLFLTKENLDEDVNIKPALQFQKHYFHESVPNCSQSTAISDLVALESSTRLENPISNLNQSWFTRRKYSSQSHSMAQKGKKKGGGGYEESAGLSLLLSKENYCKLKVEEQEEENEEEDGFRTPTSLDHRISEAKQCPPAPKKPKPSLKRRALHSHTHTCTPLYLSSKEVQLLFPVQRNLLSDSHRITKKVRRDDSR